MPETLCEVDSEPGQRAQERTPNRPVAVVTGASSGIGRALALELACHGYRLGLVARRQATLEELAREIRAHGGMAHVSAADVGDRQALHSAVRNIESAIGPVEVMVANAGMGVPTRLDPINIAEVEETIRVNLLGVVYSVEAVLPGLLARRRGQIVAVSSMASFKGIPGESAYCASKAAINVFMEGLRIALRDTDISVVTVCPGFVDTPIVPMDTPAPFMISAESAARRIARLIVRRKSGLVKFPWPMAVLMNLFTRLPDSLIARIVGYR